MNCESCGSKNTEVKDSRPSNGGSWIRRRRRCSDCSARFSTYEIRASFLERLREATKFAEEAEHNIKNVKSMINFPINGEGAN